jgi:hypothetical protein
MGDYLRSTRECTLDEMPPALVSAVRTHLGKNGLENITSSLIMACETTSTKQKKGLFGGKTERVTCGVLLTAQWLVWAAGKDNETPGVISARLNQIQVQDYEKSDLYKLVQDTGLNITGLAAGPGEVGSAFIGLGPEPAAQKFRELLRKAMQTA